MDTKQYSMFDDIPEEFILPWETEPDVAFGLWVKAARSPRGGFAYTPLSCTQFKSMWGQFTQFLRSRDSTVLNATPGLISAFLTQQKGVGQSALAPVTIRRYLSLLSRVYESLRKDQLCKMNPARELMKNNRQPLAPSVVAHLPASLDAQFIERASALPTGTWKQWRDKTMLLLLPGSGLTQTEVLRLTLADLHLDEDVVYIEVPAHGLRDARAVSLSPFAQVALQAWLEYRNEVGLATPELFPAKVTGSALNPSTLYRHIEALLTELGITQQCGARRLRHTFALRQLQNGASEKAVKDWLGLETDEMLGRYRRLVPNRFGVTAI